MPKYFKRQSLTMQQISNISFITRLRFGRAKGSFLPVCANITLNLGVMLHCFSKWLLIFAAANSRWDAVSFKVSYLSCTAAKLIDFPAIRHHAHEGTHCTEHSALHTKSSARPPWGAICYFTPNLFSSFLEIDGRTRGYLMSPVQYVSERINFAPLNPRLALPLVYFFSFWEVLGKGKWWQFS